MLRRYSLPALHLENELVPEILINQFEEYFNANFDEPGFHPIDSPQNVKDRQIV